MMIVIAPNSVNYKAQVRRARLTQWSFQGK